VPGYTNPESASTSLRRQVYGAFVVLLASGAIFTLPDRAKEETAALLRNTVLAPFIGMNSFLIGMRAQAAETDMLRGMIDAMTAERLGLNTLEEENRRLRALLDLKELVGPSWRAAEAVRPGTTGSEGIFLLNIGSRDGVSERAPVITREGLAGVVTELRRGQAVGMDWTHPEFRASAMSEDGLTFGLVRSERGAFREEDRLVLEGTPYNTVLPSGTVVLTSGLGGTFPRGIAIGRIVGVLDEEGGWRRSYYVEPFVEPGAITLVLVGRGGFGSPSADSIGAARAWPSGGGA
jgi:rod shape-determining protein MreC